MKDNIKSLFMYLIVFMVAYWCYEFGLNEDLSIVTYSESTEGKDKIYPTMSMCLQNPFKKHRQQHMALTNRFIWNF